MWRTKWAISEFWKKKTPAFFFRQTNLVARDKGAFNRCCHIPLHAYIYAACTPINAQEHLVLQDHNPRMLDVLYKYPILHCDASHLWDIHEVWTIFRSALRSSCVRICIAHRHAGIQQPLSIFLALALLALLWLTLLPVAVITELWSHPFIRCPQVNPKPEISSTYKRQMYLCD